MDQITFIKIRSSQSKIELTPFLKSSNLTIRRYANERLRELKEDIFNLEEVLYDN